MNNGGWWGKRKGCWYECRWRGEKNDSAATGGDPIVSLLRALDGLWSAGAFDKL